MARPRLSASVAVAAGAIGLGYTLFSEWLDIEVRGAWAYRDLMPVLPVIRPSADLTEYRCFGDCRRVRRARSAFERQMPTRNVSAHAMFGDVKGGFR